jgi:hypothetical protein
LSVIHCDPIAAPPSSRAKLMFGMPGKSAAVGRWMPMLESSSVS